MKWLDGFYTEEMSAQGYYGSLGLCVQKEGDQYKVLSPQDGMGAEFPFASRKRYREFNSDFNLLQT